MVYPHFTPTQIKSLRKSSQIATQTFQKIKRQVKPGLTEKQVATQINRFIKDFGADALAFRTIVAAGSHSAHVHHKNTTRKIRKNDIVLLDFGCKVKGTLLGASLKKLASEVYLCSDFSRTIFIGKPKPEWQKVYHIVKTAHQKAIKFLNVITPLRCITDCTFGIEASKLDAIARNYITKKGYGKYFLHGLGHGIGTHPHQYFRINPKSRAHLKLGFVFTIEPGIYLKGKFGVRLEDIIYLSPKGPEILTKM